MATHEQIVAGVKAYATEHYEEGWDVVVEAMTDEEIEKFLFERGEQGPEWWRPRTVNGALLRFKDLVSVRAERLADAKISAGEEGEPESKPSRRRPKAKTLQDA